MCRSAGYYRHAVFLAEKHHQHDWYLKIQLDDVKDYSKALDYISKLDFDEVIIIIVVCVHRFTLLTYFTCQSVIKFVLLICNINNQFNFYISQFPCLAQSASRKKKAIDWLTI